MSERNKGIISLVFLAFLWAFIAVIPRFLQSSFTLLQQVYLRLFLAFFLSLLIFRKKINLDSIKKIKIKDMVLLISRSFFYYALGVVFFTQALLLTKISNVTFIDSVPMVVLLGFLFLKEKFYFKKVFFVLTSFLGVLIISARTGIGISSVGKGELFALASAFFISLAMISRKWHSNKLNDQEIATITLLFGSFFVFIISLFLGESLPFQNWTPTAIFFVFLGAILNVGISFFLNFGLSRVDTALSSNLFSLTPVFALILGLVLFKEIPLIKELIGGTLILISVVAIHNLERSND